MIPAFEVNTRGIHGLTGDKLLVDPAAGTIIKTEPDTIVWRQTLFDGTQAILKVYLHRKFAWIKQRGLVNVRPEREFLALHRSTQHHVACCLPLFWAIGKTGEGVNYELLATREIIEAMDIKDWMNRRDETYPPDLKPLFALVASLHRAGIQHGALLARNILINRRGFHLIDFPRSHIFGKSIEGRPAGCFDIKLLLQNLKRYMPDSVLVEGLAAYPSLPGSAERFLMNYKNKRFNRLQRPLIRVVHALQAWFSRLFADTAISQNTAPQ